MKFKKQHSKSVSNLEYRRMKKLEHHEKLQFLSFSPNFLTFSYDQRIEQQLQLQQQLEEEAELNVESDL